MATYKPKVFMYYGTNNSNDHKISPAPNFSMAINMEYAGDTIVGYTYSISLQGTVTSLDLTDLAYGATYNPDTRNQKNIGALSDSIIRLRKRLNENGNILYIVDAQTGTVLLKAMGGILRSFTINNSNNNWVNSAPFSAQIDFDAVEINEDEQCSDSLFNAASFPSAEGGIVNNTKYKIKSFNDTWSFDFTDTAYNKSAYSDTGAFTNLNNVMFDIKYQIEATGKSSYVYSQPETDSTAKILPAWVQAKNFVQIRLREQVTKLIGSVVKQHASCQTGTTLSTVNVPVSGDVGILNDLDSNYVICNENINCESSESEGRFSITYSASVCSTNGHTLLSSPYATHTVNKSITRNNELSRPEIKVSVNGTIQGMMPGGLITNTPQGISLPDRGEVFLATTPSGLNRYGYAKQILDTFYDPSDYGAGKGKYGKVDFRQFYKDLFGINATTLGISVDPNDPYSTSAPHPISFNLTTDPTAGTITYSAEYSSIANRCGKLISNATIDIEEPVKVIANIEFPNGGCSVVQKLGTYTAKKVNVNVEGWDYNLIAKPLTISTALINCPECDGQGYIPDLNLPPGALLTDQQFTSNPITGAFSLSLGYICSNACTISY
jgi:hypothetical protein